jgi:SAM-dependent methyltransferase
MTVSQNKEVFEAALASLQGTVPNAEEYNRLCTLSLEHPLATEMIAVDPFSAEYRAKAMRLYLDLRGRGDGEYKPEVDELTGDTGLPADIWRHSSPWSFRSSQMAAEFLICWGHIMRLLDLPNDSSASILEYGSGSGQLLLLLARMGLDVHAVDIDQPSLDLVAAQANRMGLNIKCERALFGEGFEGQKFDRIIFFEAFHHAWNFESLLERLSERLNPGGLLILCGEPVVSHPTQSIPFPWGPRLDALSIFCMRHFGWMELGFCEDFLIDAFNLHGWLISDHHIAGCGRASAFVAKRALGTTVKLGEDSAVGQRFSEGWDTPEGKHRWTNRTTARFPNPLSKGVDISVRFSNFLPVKKNVLIRCGQVVKQMKVPAGEIGCEILLPNANGKTIEIECEVHRPTSLIRGSTDNRNLGIAVSEIEFHQK